MPPCFRLTNRDDRKGPGLARYLMQKMGKTRALVIDDGTPYGVGLADQFVAGFGAGGTVVARKSVNVGERRTSPISSTPGPGISTCCSLPAFAKAR